MSQLSTEDAAGSNPPFRYTPEGAKADALAILNKEGANAFRMRIWNQPTAQYSYANITGTLAMARRCKAHNLSFILDFHYSDWWADPGKQNKPAAWANLSPTELLAAVTAFSKSTVQQLVAQGTPPVAVQIGNEVSNGLMWAPKGQPCENGGYLGTACKENNWPAFAKLIAAGIGGVKEACPMCLIAIHTGIVHRISFFFYPPPNLIVLTHHLDRLGQSYPGPWHRLCEGLVQESEPLSAEWIRLRPGWSLNVPNLGQGPDA